jgi:hypothetical protein
MVPSPAERRLQGGMTAMNGRTMLALIATGAMLASGSAASAQRERDDTPRRQGACFYEHADYRGQYFCAQVGDDISRLPAGANDRVSSIRLLGGAEVTIFDNTQFRGGSLRLNSDVPNLADEGFNDRISSILIENRYRRDGYWGDRPSSGTQNVDRIIRRAYLDILQREPDRAGLRYWRSLMIDDGWSEQQVREALRTSPENRQRRVTDRQAAAEEIVRRAYLSVLNREPDPGSRGYVERVLRDDWSQRDVERELRKSREYQGR